MARALSRCHEHEGTEDSSHNLGGAIWCDKKRVCAISIWAPCPRRALGACGWNCKLCNEQTNVERLLAVVHESRHKLYRLLERHHNVVTGARVVHPCQQYQTSFPQLFAHTTTEVCWERCNAGLLTMRR